MTAIIQQKVHHWLEGQGETPGLMQEHRKPSIPHGPLQDSHRSSTSFYAAAGDDNPGSITQLDSISCSTAAFRTPGAPIVSYAGSSSSHTPLPYPACSRTTSPWPALSASMNRNIDQCARMFTTFRRSFQTRWIGKSGMVWKSYCARGHSYSWM